MPTLSPHSLAAEARLPGGGRVSIRRAGPSDAERIRGLYHEVYKGKYPLSIIYDQHETVESLSKESTLWLVSEVAGRIVGSVVFCVDPESKLSKVFAGVVLPEFRGADITERAIALGIRALVDGGQAYSVYATARTVSPAPQKLLQNLGFKELGIFPNVRKVDNYETHCLTAYFKDGVLARRLQPPRLPSSLKSFYGLVRRATGIGDAEWSEVPLAPASPYAGDWIKFEMIEAEDFVRERWTHLKAERKLQMQFFPFYEPNVLLVSQAPRAEIYLHRSTLDHHAVILGGYEEAPDLAHLLNSIVLFLEEAGVRYLELLTDAYHPKVISQIMNARFIPSAYYPGMRWRHDKGRDYIVFSKSFVVLDFKNIATRGLFSDYLREYFQIWKAMYIDGV